MAASADRVLVLPRHGRAGHGDAGPRRLQPAGARDAPALRLEAAASPGAGDGAGGLCRGDRRRGDDGGRPPALYGAWPAAHGGVRLAAAGAGGGDLAAGFHRRLLHRVRRRHLLHPPADEPLAAAGRRGARARPAGAGGRPHAVAGGARLDHLAGWRELTMLTFDLPTIWAFIIAFAIFAYVVMDGFDLGIGILFSWIPVGRERDTAINTIAPVWDGNETWLVLGGGGLLAAFPLAYGTILSALYAPIVAMLLALIFRGVAFEFRWRDPRHHPYWDIAFSIGSIIAGVPPGGPPGAPLPCNA